MRRYEKLSTKSPLEVGNVLKNYAR